VPPSTPRRLAVLCAVTVSALGLSTATALPASSAPEKTPSVVSLFPSDDLTVRDRSQLTGVRVALPTEGCATVVACGLVERLNELDGFDLDPRLAVRFDRPVDPVAVAAALTVEQVGGGAGKQSTGVDRVVYDPATSTVYAHPADQLRPGTNYRLRLRGHDLPQAQSRFTTLSAADGLLDLQRQVAGLDVAGLQVDAAVPAAGTSVQYLRDTGAAALSPTTVPSAVSAGTLVFGSYLAPSWLRADRTIAQTPTRDAGPAPVGQERLPFVLVLPPGEAPAGGWPLSVFGHGFTGSAGNVLLAAATNAQSGVATISTHVAGHGFGPRSQWRVTTADGAVQELPGYGRGVDVDGQPGISSTDGSSTSPSGAAQAVGSRDALRQTVADLAVLVRAAGSSADDVPLRADGVTYFGQSFGGIYGTMLAAVEPQVARSGLNVPGGPISEIVRLSPGFRPILQQNLFFAGLLNGGVAGFTESMPLRGEDPVLAPAQGAVAIQDFLAGSTWLNRSGSPETFAPLLDPQRVLFQVARGDQTVPNPTSYTLLAAGGLFDRASLYRNDLTPLRGANPHSFLLALGTPFQTAAVQGQTQITTFLQTGQTIDPDGAGPVWEVPVSDPRLLLSLGF
jgi:hypothetical protein